MWIPESRLTELNERVQDINGSWEARLRVFAQTTKVRAGAVFVRLVVWYSELSESEEIVAEHLLEELRVHFEHSESLALPTQDLQVVAQTTEKPLSRTEITKIIKLLTGFRWFCGPENREHVDLITSDLKKDVRTMQKENRSGFFIRSVVLWKTIGTILPICYDGCLRLLTKLIPLGKYIARFKGGL